MIASMLKRIVSTAIIACLVLIISGCATSYNSLQHDSNGNLTGELIVGDESLVIDAIYRGIRKEFPTDNVMSTGTYEKGFTWDHLWSIDRTTLRLSIKKAVAVDSNGGPVTGYFYTVDTYGTRGLASPIYVTPLNNAIRATVLASDIEIVRVTSVKEVSVTQEAHKAKTKEKSCYESLANDEELAPIKNKVSLLGSADQSFAMMVDNSRPAPEEQKVILVWGMKRDECIKESRNSLDKQGIPQVIKNVAISGASTSQMLIADLYNTKLTYAEFAKKRQELTQVVNEAITNIQIELQKQSADARARADQLALQAQQNMISAYQAVNQQQLTQQMINQQGQMINQQRQIINQQGMRPRMTTSCNFIGNTMTCY